MNIPPTPREKRALERAAQAYRGTVQAQIIDSLMAAVEVVTPNEEVSVTVRIDSLKEALGKVDLSSGRGWPDD